MWKGQYVFLEVGILLSSEPGLVITAVEQHVTITFKTERSLWIETSKNREAHNAATAENPQPPYQPPPVE